MSKLNTFTGSTVTIFSKSTLTYTILFAAFLALSTLSSCRKVYDFIRDHPDAHDTLCRITRITARGYYGSPDTFYVTYNNKGNPISMLAPHTTSFGTTEQYFRYDRFNRLSDHMSTYPGMFGALSWQKYGYPRSNFIIDTFMTYTGDVREPAPNANVANSYFIRGYTLDAHDRVVKAWSIPNDPHQPMQQTDEFIYDANGNRSLPDTLTYDDKINPYRTNKVWQFVYNDYSRNNAILKGLFVLRPTYNEFGLPVILPSLQDPPLYIVSFVENTDPFITISYACTMPKGPINY